MPRTLLFYNKTVAGNEGGSASCGDVKFVCLRLYYGGLRGLEKYQEERIYSEEICSVCGAKILRTAEFMGIKRTFRVMCKCMQKQQEQEQLNREKQERMRKIEKLKRLSLLGERYKNATFENSKTGMFV